MHTRTAVRQAADLLQEIMMRRFFESLKTRGLTQKEQEHPVWFWVITCMPALCAHFCLAGKILAEDMLRQIWQGAASWHPEQCLFADTFSFFNALLPRKEMLQGAYVFFDSLWKQFIRHGKACSDKHGFGGRHKTHLDAVVRGVSSHFYDRYPNGKFQQLSMFISVGFDQNNANEIVTDRLVGGILEWTPEAIQMSTRMSRRTAEGQRMELASYLFEEATRLLINPRLNMSRSKGWEPLGFFSK